MLARTHLAIGLLLSLIFIPLAGGQTVLFTILILFGSLLPDVDHKGSTINRLFPITKISTYFFKHRGFFHSIFPPLIIIAITSFYDYFSIGLPISLGYLGHLAADSITKMGVNYLHPLSNFRISGFITVGKMWETILFIGIMGVLAIKLFM